MSETNETTPRKGFIARVWTFLWRPSARFSLATLLIAGGLVGILFLVSYPPSAATQPAMVDPGSGNELRAMYANAEEVAEGKRLADGSCAVCHGANGFSTTPGVPHLAGQRPAYFYLELRAYQTGARGVSAMNNAVKFLSDDALFKLAAYYASLDPIQPGAPSDPKAAPANPDPVQAGIAAAASCTGCHGEIGISKTPGMPSLVGLDPKYLVAAMKGYKIGQRKHDLMKSMLGAFSDADLENIALYYALQKPERARTPVVGNQVAGKVAAAACAGCHGNQGISLNPQIPSLAGQDAQYLAAALQAYKSGLRNEETMTGPVASLDDTAIKDLSAYYATQQPQPPNVRKPLTTAEWAQRCDRCHGISGNSTDPRLPALAGQREDYLQKVLHAYRTGARKSPPMAAMSDVLTERDVENLAAYYASQKARAVVYVIVPSK